MKFTSLVGILLTVAICLSCKNSTGSKDVVKTSDSMSIDHKNPSGSNNVVNNSDTLTIDHKESQVTPILQTHLKDTLSLNGAFILFLMPDSLRFQSLEDEPGIYDADADFGVGISNTIKKVSKNKRYRDYEIKVHTTEKRFISIKDCYQCPIIIDRDTVNYGTIISSYGRKPETKTNQVHSGDYMQELRDYFGF